MNPSWMTRDLKKKRMKATAKVPKCKLSGKGCGAAQTARMLA